MNTKERPRLEPTLEEIHTNKDKVFQKILLNLIERLNRGDYSRARKIWIHLCNRFHKLKDQRKDKRKEIKLKIESTLDHEAPMEISSDLSSHITTFAKKAIKGFGGMTGGCCGGETKEEDEMLNGSGGIQGNPYDCKAYRNG